MATKKVTVKKKTVKQKAVVVAAGVAKAAAGAVVMGAAVSAAGALAKVAVVAKVAAVAVAEVKAAETAPKTRKRIYTKKRLTALLDVMLTQFADQLCGKPISFSAGDGLKMMQMREHAEPERPTEVKVGWVEEPRP